MADTDTAPIADAAPQTNGTKRGPENEILAADHKRPATGTDPAPAEAPSTSDPAESIEIKVQFGKVSKTVTRRLDSTVGQLKAEIERETGVPIANQKLLFKGQLKDERYVRFSIYFANLPVGCAVTVFSLTLLTPFLLLIPLCSMLRDTGLKNGSRLMVIGSKPEDVKVATADTAAKAKAAADWDAVPKAEPWSTQTKHKKVLDKGRPEDGWPGIAERQIPLRDDQTYIPGLLNGNGVKVRLTFKAELQQVWVGAAGHTQKIPYSSIGKLEAQAIDGQPEYSILRVQLGAAATSNYWLYWVPSQHVAAIKMRILGVAALLE